MSERIKADSAQPADSGRVGEIDALIDAAHAYAEKYKDDDRQDVITDVLNAFYQGTDWRRKHTVAPAGVPDGWRLVPVESTSEMDIAGADIAKLRGAELFGRNDAKRVWSVMLAAAPSAPESNT